MKGTLYMKLCMKRIWDYIKKKYWYIILLGFSSLYVVEHRLEIYELKEFNAVNLIFILWLILLLLPLFSEMEFLGVKIKKEVQKETEEVKETLKNIQIQVNNLQLTNSVANNFSFNNSTLPSEQKLEELLQKVTELQSTYPKSDETSNNSLFKSEDKNVYLFKVRLDIERCLHEMCEKIGNNEIMPLIKMARLLNQLQIIDGMTCDLIIQVIRIANRGVHGEIVSEEYIEFVEKTYPEIMRKLKDASAQVDEYKKWHEVREDMY